MLVVNIFFRKVQRTLKNGIVKEDKWEDTVYNAVAIRARNAEEAKEKFYQYGHEIYDDMEDYELDVQYEGVKNVNVVNMDNTNPNNIGDTLMRSVKYPKYDFISSDDKYLKNNGYCVRDCFVGKYSEKIKKLNNNLFELLCYESLGLTPPLDTFFEENVINMYDNPSWKEEVLNDDTLTQEDKNELISNYRPPMKWNPSHGVSPKMVNYICKKLNISCYAFSKSLLNNTFFDFVS